MLSGGQALERYASSRARRELSALLARAPRVVHRYNHGILTSPDIADVKQGDRLLVKPGEVVPVDGLITSRRQSWTNPRSPASRGPRSV